MLSRLLSRTMSQLHLLLNLSVTELPWLASLLLPVNVCDRKYNTLPFAIPGISSRKTMTVTVSLKQDVQAVTYQRPKGMKPDMPLRKTPTGYNPELPPHKMLVPSVTFEFIPFLAASHCTVPAIRFVLSF